MVVSNYHQLAWISAVFWSRKLSLRLEEMAEIQASSLNWLELQNFYIRGRCDSLDHGDPHTLLGLFQTPNMTLTRRNQMLRG